MKEFPGLKVLFILLLPLLVGACAVDRPPTGGPPDDTPLSVTASIPENGTVMTSPNTIRLDFNHYIGQEALNRAIYFSPSVDHFEVSVHGRQARIRLDSPLRRNRTYTLTLRNNLKSLYGNHLLGKSWALSFSTGPVIDNGSIKGEVWTPHMAPATNVTVMASQGLTNEQSPDYITQTGPSGAFHFEHLAPGNYRLVAITDKNGNLRYDPASESFAVATAKAVDASGATAIQPVNLRLSEDDKNSLPVLRSCRAINNREIELTFNRPIPSENLKLSSFTIEHTATGKPLPVLAGFSLSRATEATGWRLLTDEMDKDAWYRLHCSKGETPSELTFYANDRTDRYPALSLTLIPANGSENVIAEAIRPGSAPAAELHFNLPVVASSLTTGAVKLELIEPDGGSRAVPFTIETIDSRTYAIQPSGAFLPGRSYTLQVELGKVESMTGGSAAGSKLVASSFTIAGKELYGEINGSGNAIGARRVVIEARAQGSAFAKRLEATPSATTGEFSFSFTGLPAGRYVLSAFTPSGLSTSWNAGSVEPFTPADAFTAKTVNVRSGWSTDDIRLEIKPNQKKKQQETN